MSCEASTSTVIEISTDDDIKTNNAALAMVTIDSNGDNDGKRVGGRPDTVAIQEANDKVHEVLDLMKQNVTRVIERDGNLADLDRRATALQEAGSQFKTTSNDLKRKMFIQNVKGVLIISLIVTIFVITLLCKYYCMRCVCECNFISYCNASFSSSLFKRSKELLRFTIFKRYDDDDVDDDGKN